MRDLTQDIVTEAILSDIHVAEAVLEQAGVNLAERREQNRVFINRLKALAEFGLLGYEGEG